MPLRTGLLVAVQLLDCLLLPDLQQRRQLRLHDNEGDAVHEQHEVGLDDALIVLAGAQCSALAATTHPELRGHDVLVQSHARLWMFEIEEAHGGRLLAATPVDGEGHAVRQVLVDSLIASQPSGINVLQIEDGPLRLVVGHPRIQTLESRREPTGQQHIPLIVTLLRQRLPRHIRPAKTLQQFPGRILGKFKLVELGDGGYGWPFCFG